MEKVAVLDDYQNVALKMADWNVLKGKAQVIVFNKHLGTDNKVLVDKLDDFEIISTMRERTPFGRDLMGSLPKLKLLVTTGMRNAAIDLDAATDLGITVCGTSVTPGPQANAVPELTWGLILGLFRQIPQENAAVRRGLWETTVGTIVNKKVLGLLGLGNLGARMVPIAKAFGMSAIAWSQNLTTERATQCGAALVTKEELFSRSDVISIHLKLSDRTRGLVTKRELDLMKTTAYLFNTSRGPIVDESALIKVLQDKAIAGAGLDVFDQEPLPPKHPFLKMDNVIVTPHLGYVTKETYLEFYSESVDDILAFLKGQPVRIMNPDVLEKKNRRS